MAYLGMTQYHGQMADEYDYDDIDDFYDNNHVNNNSNEAADDSEGKLNEMNSIVQFYSNFQQTIYSQTLKKQVNRNMVERAEITANHLR